MVHYKTTEKIAADLVKGRMTDYAEKLVEWQETDAAFARALDAVCASIADLAVMAGEVEARRQALAVAHAQLRGDGIHTPGPAVSREDTRSVLIASRQGRRAAVAAISSIAKQRAGKP